MYVKNRDTLVSHGTQRGRQIVLDVIEKGVSAVDPYKATCKLVQLHNNKLIIGNNTYDLKSRGNIFVLGAGKASFPIAKALEDILGEKITHGIVLVKRGQEGEFKRIVKLEAGHPLPDDAGLQGAQRIFELAEEMREDDLVFTVITGGSSALMPLPINGISLEEKRIVTELLLNSGADIQDINAVRKHISKIKGGRLALRLHPAEIINLTVSDVIGDWKMLDYITDNTIPDTSTFQDARDTLKKYDLWNRVPYSVKDHLQSADPRMETPKRLEGIRIHTHILATNEMACMAAIREAEALGLNSMILSTKLEGESVEAGILHAGIAREITEHNRPLKPPCIIVSGGETTVTIEGIHGNGGPNQEFALGCATKINGYTEIVAASIDTDGTDGPTEAAGGIVDGDTLTRANACQLDIFESLRRHDAFNVLSKLQDTIYTGATGTNVMNLRVLAVLKNTRN
jgi:glycerate 2-kinase